MRTLGLDLAWSKRNRTALAARSGDIAAAHLSPLLVKQKDKSKGNATQLLWSGEANRMM